MHAITIDALVKRTDELVRKATDLSGLMKAQASLANDLEKEAGLASQNVLVLMCGGKVGELLPQTAVKLHNELTAEAKKARHLCKVRADEVIEALTHVGEIKRLTYTEIRLEEVEARLETLEARLESKARLESLRSSNPGGVTKKRKCGE